MGVTELVLRDEIAWVAGGGMILLAVFLLYLSPRDRVLRAFAAFLVVRGSANLPPTPLEAFDNERIIILPFVALWFLLEYHWRARLRPPRRLVLAGLGLATISLLTLHQLRETWPLPDWLHIVNILYSSRFLAYSVIAFVLAADGLRRSDPAERWPLLMVSGAFALNPLLHVAVTVRGVPLPDFLLGGLEGVFWAQTLPRVLAFLTLATTGLMIAARLALRPAPRLRHHAVLYLGALCAVLASALLVAWLDTLRLGFGSPYAIAFDRLWTLPVPFVVGYVLLRNRLFDLDLRLKRTLVAGLILGAFSATFFVAEELAERVVPWQGDLFGLAAAGVLALAFMPLRRLTRSLVDRIMPGVQPSDAYLHRRKVEVYRTAVEASLGDTLLSPKERRVLDALASHLGLRADEASQVEAECMLRIHQTGDASLPQAEGAVA